MNPYHVIMDCYCKVRVPGYPVRQQTCRWIWTPKDPAAVKLRLFEDDGGLNDWLFARELLINGSGVHQVHGDVTVKHYQELRKVRITLNTDGMVAVLEFDEETISRFVGSTLRQLPEEQETYDLDETIRRLLDD